jgi:hypothetical protein
MSHVLGSFKLKNDPKSIGLTDENVLFCGSKLFGAEVIGLVLYTGQDTRVFQQNSARDCITKKPTRHKTIFISIAMSLFMGVVSSVYRLIQSRGLQVLVLITGRSAFSVVVLTLIDGIIFQLHQGAPLLFVFIVELVNYLKHTKRCGNGLEFLQQIWNSFKRCCCKHNKPTRNLQEGVMKDSLISQKKLPELYSKPDLETERLELKPNKEVHPYLI